MFQESPPTSSSPEGGVGCLARLFWLIVGYLILIVAGVAIAKTPGSWSLSWADLIYWAALASMVAARYSDIRYLSGRTSDGQQLATWADWKRYSLVLVVVGLIAWLVLHAVAGYAR